MFRYVLSLTLAVSYASAATISTTATCDGVTTVGTTFARCSTPDVLAQASVGLTSVSVLAEGTSLPFGPGSASASFSADEVFTVNGGTGGGFFFPCFDGAGFAMVGMSFGGVAFGIGDTGDMLVSNCRGPNTLGVPPQPLTFGVPQIVHISNTGFASSGSNNREFNSSESFERMLFFDASGNVLPNATFTLVEVPEPSAWSLLSIGMMFFVAVRIRAMRFHGRFHRCDLR